MTLSAPAAPVPTRSEHQERISVLCGRMRADGLAAVALASPENVYYLLGLDHLGYFAFTLLVVPASGEPVLVTRAMEAPTVRAQVPWCRHVTFGDGEVPSDACAGVLAGLADPGDAVALDEGSMFFPPAIATAIRAALPGLRWVPGSELLAAQRAVKSASEVALVRQAARISDVAMAAGLATTRTGTSEQTVAAAVYGAMIDAGGQPPGFAPLIRGTDVLDQEHVGWSGRTVSRGQGLFFELSASVRRYHAPQSRIVYVGEPATGAARAAAVALDGLHAATEALRPGTLTGEVYAAWQRAAVPGGDPARPVRHHCGYLVGIGFPPSWVGGGEVLGIRAGGDVHVEPGMVFHLMSWVTDPVGHVVSDTALVTDSGAELLTSTSRELTVLAG